MNHETHSMYVYVAGFYVVTLLAGLATGSMAATEDSFTFYPGTASDLHSGKFLYRENHLLRYHEGRLTERIVLYTCSDGTAFARKTVASAGEWAPDFVLDDASNGMREGVRTQGNARQAFFRGDWSTLEKTSTVSKMPGLVADTGFDTFVRNNWQALLNQETLSMDFLIPSRLSIMSFKIKHLRRDHVDGIEAEVFRLNLSGVLGLIAPSIDVFYGASDHLLMRYVGLSDLRDASNDNYQADIVFHPVDRRQADESSIAGARLTLLSACKH